MQYKLCIEPSQYYFQSLDCLDYHKNYHHNQGEIWQKILVSRQTNSSSNESYYLMAISYFLFNMNEYWSLILNQGEHPGVFGEDMLQ